MSNRSEYLATAFEQVINETVATVEGLSDSEWRAIPAGELRTAGQLAYHIAEASVGVTGFVQMVANGHALPALSLEQLDAANAAQAARYQGAGRAAALELLHTNRASAATTLRSLSDAQLDATAEVFGQTVTAEGMGHYSLVGHLREHLASVRSIAAGA